MLIVLALLVIWVAIVLTQVGVFVPLSIGKFIALPKALLLLVGIAFIAWCLAP